MLAFVIHNQHETIDPRRHRHRHHYTLVWWVSVRAACCVVLARTHTRSTPWVSNEVEHLPAMSSTGVAEFLLHFELSRKLSRVATVVFQLCITRSKYYATWIIVLVNLKLGCLREISTVCQCIWSRLLLKVMLWIFNGQGWISTCLIKDVSFRFIILRTILINNVVILNTMLAKRTLANIQCYIHFGGCKTTF